MKNERTIPGLKGRPFNGRLYPKIKRPGHHTRQKIRQLLRSFVPLEDLKKQNNKRIQSAALRPVSASADLQQDGFLSTKIILPPLRSERRSELAPSGSQ
jgi:hypothetical protein